MAADTVILGIIIGTLAAIVYSLRVLILLERLPSSLFYRLSQVAI